MAYQPKFTITPQLLAFIENIAALREKILAATVQVPWIPTLQKDARIRNTHSSTAIEGNPLTPEQVRLLEEGQSLPTEPHRAPRNAWRRQLHKAITAVQRKSPVAYQPSDKLEVEVRLFMTDSALGLHDVDNRLKDI